MKRPLLLLLTLASAPAARADGGVPPWSDPGDLPVPTWARSVVPIREDELLRSMPDVSAPRRGSVALGARLPLYGARRGEGCEGRWLLVGPYAWICSDAAELSVDDPFAPIGRAREGFMSTLPPKVAGDGLPYRYYFVGPDGASGFRDLAHADEESPDEDFEPGFAVALTEERVAHGERWGRTRRGEWVALRELSEARVSPFRGEDVSSSGSLEFAWVGADRANVYTTAAASKLAGSRVHFDVVPWREEQAARGGAMVRVSEDGAPAAWMRKRDLVRPKLAPPPDEIGGAATRERWIDIELVSQTLVAYEGTRPVYATLVSTGRGPLGSDSATPPGVHRIWVKLSSTNMGNLEKEDAEDHYSIEDVPYVQFFDRGVALHGAFWHRSFGQAHSHGCVNLPPADAEWLFAFTSPHLPPGWSAALPVRIEPGTAVRVR